MKKVKFGKGIKRIEFPVLAEIEGESIKAIRRISKEYKLPKHTLIGFRREICFDRDSPFDLTTVFIEK